MHGAPDCERYNWAGQRIPVYDTEISITCTHKYRKCCSRYKSYVTMNKKNTDRAAVAGTSTCDDNVDDQLLDVARRRICV